MEYQKGANNFADFLSRHARNWSILSQDEQEESNDLSNLLYALHISPFVDAISIKTIAEHTANDIVLQKLLQLVKQGKTYTSDPDLQIYCKILPEITYTANGILFKYDKMILPQSLHKKAIKLAHCGGHPGQNKLMRRLRSHFYIRDLDAQVKKFVEECPDCQAFTSKRTKEPIQPNTVPENCWEEVSVDLFGPLPRKCHIVMVQDLASRYPTAKIVSNTSAKAVLPVLKDAYDTFGNPEVQKSDNGPPFNSKAMADFTEERGIEV